MAIDLSRNMLDREVSPYLLQHKDNPVHWQVWGPELLQTAQALNKPILLSTGYAACHWCHVMAHESFEDEATAALMNALFINVKMDREERPDLDAIYQQALSLLGQQGGWPLTMFLTPKGEPFWGGTYFPPENRWGRPAFSAILQRVADLWRQDPNAIEQNRAALMQALSDDTDPSATPGVNVTPTLLDGVADRLLQIVDLQGGGIQGAPKFPHIPVFALLWRAHLRTGRDAFGDAVAFTLRQMSQGGIYDHVGGGYSRYCVDDRWLVPHFEKMLYDNAQILDLLVTVGVHKQDPLLLRRAEETVDWLLREMIADQGAFAAALDADSEGEEGKFYVWDEHEIDSELESDAEDFKPLYDVTPDGNWEGQVILNRLGSPDWLGDEQESRFAEKLLRLRKARQKRPHPGRDDKVLADWNGLMIAALARAGARCQRPDWMMAARPAYDGVLSLLSEGNMLMHAARAGQRRQRGMLDDYAFMADAALALFEATGDFSLIDQARGWTDLLQIRFWDRVQGGYFVASDEADDLIVRRRALYDQAVPSGSAVMLGVLSKLARLTGEEKYLHTAEALIEAFAPHLTRNVFGLATFLNAVEDHRVGVDIVIIKTQNGGEHERLLSAAWHAAPPGALILSLDEMTAASLPKNHPAFGKTLIDARPTAYVCRAQSCTPPVTDADALIALLSPLRNF